MALFLRLAAVPFALLAAFVFPAARAQHFTVALPPTPPVVAHQTAQGFDATAGEETLSITVCTASAVHVVWKPHAGIATHPQPWLLPPSQSCPGAPFTFAQEPGQFTLKTSSLQVALSLKKDTLFFLTADGREMLNENGFVARTYTPITRNGQSTFDVEDRFSLNPDTALYGLGQHQGGLFNYRGNTVKLAQDNTDIAIPFLTTNDGYGILWNTAALTYVDNRTPLVLRLDSTAGDSVDYFFLYGPEMDSLIHQYRGLTGHAPLLPRWAYGFIQSKDRYASLDEIQSIAARYRSEHIPMDAMVQDWFWWKTQGDPLFNDHYHDVPAALAKLHAEHVHAMISTWALLDPASETYKKLDAGGLLIPNTHVYDASSARARGLYWNSLPGPLLAQGWDAFWLDSAEPEEYWPHGGDAVLRDKKLSIGSGALYTNVFPLLHNENIAQHWRAANDSKRVFLLTRSAFLGQQRLGMTVWSGDIYSNWWALSRQVPAGLNYALSGMPYWTTDIGGYLALSHDQSTQPAYQELYLRWFEFGVFCPIFRTHGHRPNNEIWSYPTVEPSLTEYDNLRYRLMPYIYSLAARVSNGDYTIERPLVMDFRADPATWNIGDQFLFGPALLVNPITQAGATSRSVYLPALPAGAPWFDFWTGEKLTGGQHLQAAAPLNRIPLYVRAGSILPLGPEEDYASEKGNGPIELRIYPGADGSFTLYQDEGDNYDYEKGQSATATLTWSDADRTLTLGPRIGSYPGMSKETPFRIVVVRPNHGTGEAAEPAPDKTFLYRGFEMKLKLD